MASNLYKTKEEARKGIDFAKKIIAAAEGDLNIYQPICDKFDGRQEDDLTTVEVEEWKNAQPYVNNAKTALTKYVPLLRELEEKLTEMEKASSLPTGDLSVDDALLKIKQINLPARKEKRSNDAMSVYSGLSTHSRLKQQQLKIKKRLSTLQAVHEADVREIDAEIENKNFDLTNPCLDEAEKIKLERDVQRLQLKKDQAIRKFQGESHAIKTHAQIEEDEIRADDDYQFLNNDEEKLATNYVYPDDRRKLPPLMEASTAKLKTPLELQRVEDPFHNYRHSPAPSGYYTENESVTHADEVRTVPECKTVVDKDALLLQLMQTQMNFLQKSQVSPGDKFLPEFHLDPAQWGNFKAAYDRISKHKPDNSEMMMRLQKVLKGNARVAVEHLMANVINVPKIIETLEFQYGRPEYVLDYLIEKTKTCCKPEPSKPESIIEFGRNVEALVANICAFNEEDYLHSRQLVNELVDKMPGAMKDEWHTYLLEDSQRRRNVETFALWIKKKSQVAMYRIKPTVSPLPKSENSKSSPRRGPGTTNAATGNEENKTTAPSSGCPCCGKKNHDLERCWVFQKKNLNERWSTVKESKLCFCCLKAGHRTSDCSHGRACGENGCSKNHHKLLHSAQRSAGQKENNNEERKTAVENPKPSAPPLAAFEDATGSYGVAVIIEGTDGPLAIVPVRVRKHDKQGWRTTYALLDSGATRTLISQDLASRLGLFGDKITYKFKPLGSSMIVNSNAMKVNLCISGRYRNAKEYPLTDAVTVADIGIPPYSINIDEVKRRWPHLGKMKGTSLTKVVPELIIGGDHGFLMMHLTCLYKTIREPVAVRTLLGWVIQGKFPESGEIKPGMSYHVGGIEIIEDKLHNMIKESFKLDDYGLKPLEKSLSPDNRKALEIMKQTTFKENGRWTTGLLWKSDEPLNPGVSEAMTRLWQTEKRMKRDPAFAEVYKAKIAEYIQKKFIRKLTNEEAATTTKRTRYIPHFGVTNPNKPGKFRLVFDAASVAGGKSLNDMLYTGPDLIRPLVSVLMNFRKWKIVLCGDIEDMFHRIYIRLEDRCAQRFFWRNGESHRQADVYEMMVMMFGTTSSPCSAIYVKNENAQEYNDKYPAAVNAIINDIYFDDLLSGGDTPAEVIKLREDITTINSSGGFNMKKFISNSKEVMDSIPSELRMDGGKALSQKSMWESERVLGLWWNPRNDTFSFKLNFHKVHPEVMNGRRPTKREVCSLLMSLYDPLGFINHYKIKGMILLQRIWRTGIGWDDDVSDEIFKDWLRWLKELEQIVNVKIPRCYGISNSASGNVQLHTLVDSSAEGYCAVCYYRVESESRIDISFVASRVKVAPLKKTTIPRLELQAAFLGAKLATQIMKEVNVRVDKCYFWSDSSTVLSWIKNETGRFPEFIANRVGFIQEATNAEDWRWVPTAENVADDGTRCDSPTDLSSESRWLNGPAFLKLDQSQWPKKVTQEDGVIAVMANSAFEDVAISSSSTENEKIWSLPKVNRFSSYYRLVRATAAVGAAAEFWIQKTKKKSKVASPWMKTEIGLMSRLNPKNLDAAEKRLLRFAQLEFQHGKLGQKKLPLLKNLNVFQDENGILRVRGRITRADATEEMKNPAVLPGNHHIASLIVDAEHIKNAHTGKETVFNNLRQRYWITGGRNVVRKCFARCNFCKISRAKPVIPEMGDLPSYRLAAYQPVFSFTGVDFFGPVEITVGRRHEKRWVALFTCMVTRATYLDIAAGLSKEDMMHVFSRFVDTYGVPRHMYSDNGTNFVAVEKEISSRSLTCSMKWHFIPPGSPHFGGAWERMVQVVKKVLRNILKEKFPREETLRTTLKAAENIVNCRPLTYVSSDPNDPESLTPNHFLRGASVCSSSAVLGHDVGKEAESGRSHFLRSQYYINLFWKRWSHEVLPDLVRRTKWYDNKEPVREGDIVLLVDEQQPRNTWMKGIITRTFPGNDGLVRVVEVTTKLPSSNKKTSYKRSVAKICPIGLRVEGLVADSSPDAPKPGAGML